MFNKKLFQSLSVILMTCNACSTPTQVEEKAPLPVVPEYVKVPHPAGFDLGDLRAILLNPLAPKDISSTFAETCSEEFEKLSALTSSPDERKKGARELVEQDAERMHWCFYAKISKLQETLQTDSTWSERQKKVIESFSFLSPVANAFMDAYHDSRYLRWATYYYSKISEWVFFKKLTPTAENTYLLTTGSRELEPWISVQRNESKTNSVFVKYGLSLMPSVAAALNPFESAPSTPTAPSVAPPARVPASSAEDFGLINAALDETILPQKAKPAAKAANGLPPDDPSKAVR